MAEEGQAQTPTAADGERRKSQLFAEDDDDMQELGYQVKKLDLQTQLELDKDDEALNKWKESLLGGNKRLSTSADPRRVVIKSIKLIFDNRPGGDIVYPVDTPEGIESMKKNSIVMKENAEYYMEVVFRVQHDICSAFRYQHKVFKGGKLKVESRNHVFGSYGPSEEDVVVKMPKEKVPSGFLARGSYTGKARFTDDDNNCHLEYAWSFKISKDWKSTGADEEASSSK